MPKTLKQNVHVDGKWYGPDYGNADLPDAVAKQIENEGAFEAPGTGSPDLRFREDDFLPDGVPNLERLGRAFGRGTGSTVVDRSTGEPRVEDLERDDLAALATSRGIEVGPKEPKAAILKKLGA